MLKKLMPILAMALIGVLFPCGPVYSAMTQAKLTYVGGNVDISRDGKKWTKADRGTFLSQDSRLRVGNNGAAVVTFTDGSDIRIRENTKIRITDLRIKGNSKIIEIKLTYGRLLAKVRKLLTKKSKFNVSAGSAVCGVRGTQFYMSYDQGTFEVKNIEGQVFVRLQDDVKYLNAGRKLAGDMNGMGQILHMSPDDYGAIDEYRNHFRGVLSVGDGASVEPDNRQRKAELRPRLGLRLRERHADSGKNKPADFLRNTISKLVTIGSDTMVEGSDNVTSDVILPNISLVIYY